VAVIAGSGHADKEQRKARDDRAGGARTRGGLARAVRGRAVDADASTRS
jgi:hypothetical protein